MVFHSVLNIQIKCPQQKTNQIICGLLCCLLRSLSHGYDYLSQKPYRCPNWLPGFFLKEFCFREQRFLPGSSWPSLSCLYLSPRRESLSSPQAKLEHPTTTHCQNKHLKITTHISEAQIYMWRGNGAGNGGETHKMPAGLDILSLLKQLGIHSAHFWCISWNFRIKFCSFSSEHKCSCASFHPLLVAQD